MRTHLTHTATQMAQLHLFCTNFYRDLIAKNTRFVTLGAKISGDSRAAFSSATGFQKLHCHAMICCHVTMSAHWSSFSFTDPRNSVLQGTFIFSLLTFQQECIKSEVKLSENSLKLNKQSQQQNVQVSTNSLANLQAMT